MLTFPESVIEIIMVIPEEVAKASKSDILISRLSDSEKMQFSRFPFSEEKMQYLLTRNLVRKTLGTYYSKPPKDLNFETDVKGKMSVVIRDNETPLYFNISHCKGLIACAFSRLKFIGLDVENIRRPINHLELAQSAFSSSEISLLSKLAPDEMQKYFFKIWTLKEAYLKALGVGIIDNLEDLSFTVTENQISLDRPQNFFDKSTYWRWHLDNPSADHQLALAYQSLAPIEIKTSIINNLD